MGRQGVRVAAKAASDAAARHRPPRHAGTWSLGVAAGPAGMRRFRLFRPATLAPAARAPLLVMLHGCGQDAASFARATRMNALAAREGFLVLYPEQDRLANAQGCWNWFETRSGRAFGEVALVMSAVDQACALHRADPARVAVAGFSAGAGLAALLASRYPTRFRAVTMHSGVGTGRASSGASALRAMAGLGAAGRSSATFAASSIGPVPPLLVVQGDGDTVVARANGRAAAQAWAERLGAREGAPRLVQRRRRHPATQTDWRAGGRVVVSLVEVHGLAHAWSGGSSAASFADPEGPDASRWAWAFSRRQFGS